MSYRFSGNFADINLRFSFRYKKTAEYFGAWIISEPYDSQSCIQVASQDYEDVKNKWDIDSSPYTEFSLSVYRACNEMLKYDRCIFHGAAFLWHEKAFIFTAPSGTGKSTQVFNWLELYREEIQIMNGDKPILCKTVQNHVTVYPSPWKGKEGLGNDKLKASLGGIIILNQGVANQIKRLTPDKSVPQLLKRILFTVESRDNILQASSIVDAIVSSVPVWLLTNKGDLDSARLTHDVIQKELDL